MIEAPSFPLAGAHIFVDRPFRAIPEPEPFIEGAVVAFTEELIRAGYDTLGHSYDPRDEETVLLELEELNRRLPGTGAIHLTFVELPTLVTLGTQWLAISCRVFGSGGELLLDTDLEPPQIRVFFGLLVPDPDPEGSGRAWAHGAWARRLAPLFRPRGRPAAVAREEPFVPGEQFEAPRAPETPEDG